MDELKHTPDFVNSIINIQECTKMPTSERLPPIHAAEDKYFQLAGMHTAQPPCTARVPQIIPEWAIDHLGKKVRFIRPYFDGYRIWAPEQVATLDGLQVGESGIECVVYFDDYDDSGYLSAPSEFFMPVHEDRRCNSSTNDNAEPRSTKSHFHSFILGLVVELLARARVDATTAQKAIDKHFMFK